MKINLYEMFCTDTLRHRDTARKLIEELSREPESHPIIIDFDKIDFASRSFLHELLSDLGNREIVFENRNKEVEKMMGVILRSAKTRKAMPTITSTT